MQQVTFLCELLDLHFDPIDHLINEIQIQMTPH